MAEISSRILRRMKELDFSYGELSARTGIPKAMLHKYATGEVGKIPLERIAAIADGLGLSPQELAGWDVPAPDSIGMPEYYHVPLIGGVAAGEPIYDEGFADEYVNAQINADCAMVVKGNSMYPRYMDGDIVYIRSQDDVSYDGEIAVVVVDDEATLKHVHHIPGGLRLRSENPAYPDMVKTLEEYSSLRILGIVLGFTRIESRH